ncbi:putative transporter [Cladobotryum mycophilum]|uniref:Transporter n=1 Tax=Cladobotryum mycophilum TaxID=491253 RepID=A0ABR0STM2_9HYPO
MRLSLPLVLGALLGVSQSSVVVLRQAGSHDDSSPAGGGDTTTTTTVTVTTDGAGSTVTKETTTLFTSTTTIFATVTVFETATVTGNQDTATKVVYSTTTILINKRAVNAELPRRTAPAQVEAVPTPALYADYYQRRALEKRATIVVTVTNTVTGKAGSDVTITNTVSKTAVATKSAETTTTSTITVTEQVNAKATVTTTSLLTVYSTIVTTGVIHTITGSPTNTGAPANTGGSGSGGGDSSSGSLSTGAKVGIGLGAGVGGLAVIGGLLWLVFRRRSHGPSPDPDDLVGASEVPVGFGGPGGPGGRNPAMTASNTAAAAGFLAPGRQPVKPNSPEGYRGTAMADGRTGFAKPDTYGSNYSTSPAPTSVSPLPTTVSPMTTTTSPVYDRPNIAEIGPGHAEATPAAELGTDGGAGSKWHDPNATEIDSNPVMSHLSGPVYEMPTQHYRVNIGNARLYGLEKDLGLQGDQFQVAVSILFVTYLVFEVPSNLVLKLFTPRRWIAFIATAWGIIATLSGLVDSYASLIACRLLLGVVEAGLFPGLAVYLTLFYTKHELALRIGYLFVSAAIAGAVGGLLAYGIGHLDGARGMSGWRWILIIEGIPSAVLGVVTYVAMPNDAQSAYFLSEDEKALMEVRHRRDYGNTASSREFNKEDMVKAFADWKVWAFCVAQFGVDTMLYGFSTFLPTIIEGLGEWTTAQVQLLTIPCYFLGAVAYMTAATLSDRLQKRGVFTVVFGAISVVGYGILLSDSPAGVHYFGCFLVAGGLYVVVGLPLAWLPGNTPRYGKRTTATGLQLTLGNTSGIIPKPDGPRYTRGHAVSLSMVGLGTVIYAFLWFWLRRENQRRDAGEVDEKYRDLDEEELKELGDDSPHYRYTT